MSDKIQVLIVEDDRIILEDLATIIDWEAEGFHIAATARNGKLGFAAWEKHHPQLIVADIQMPVMDGLTMMLLIREQDEDAAFLILSSYSEFEYAKEAVRLGTDAYLLKAEISAQLMVDTLRPIRSKLISRRMVQGMTDRHQLFSHLSAGVETGTPELADEESISAAFHSYYRSCREQKDWKRQLEWVIRECYSILSITERGSACPEGDDPAVIEQWMLESYRDLVRLREFIHVRKYSPVIINACQYIEANYANPQLKIGTVANSVGLSSSRLSVLFKQETGKTVNDFITETRIEDAKKMPKSGRYKVYEVSDMVGYKTGQYFSQIFQQYTGASPTDYLRRHIK